MHFINIAIQDKDSGRREFAPRDSQILVNPSNYIPYQVKISAEEYRILLPATS